MTRTKTKSLKKKQSRVLRQKSKRDRPTVLVVAHLAVESLVVNLPKEEDRCLKPLSLVKDLTKDYITKSETVHALRGVSFDVPEGDYVAIMGPSDPAKVRCLILLVV